MCRHGLKCGFGDLICLKKTMVLKNPRCMGICPLKGTVVSASKRTGGKKMDETEPKKEVSKELVAEVSKVVSDNLRATLSSALPIIASGRTMRAIDLCEVGPMTDYKDIYREGGGHGEQYKANYSETGYQDHYSDTRSTITRVKDFITIPEHLSRDALIHEADLMRTELAAKNAMIERLHGGRLG